MRIAELSQETGVSIPTIKYYIREGLISPGERTSRNQAQYGPEHRRRLGLVRALVDVGGLSLAATRRVLDHLEAPDTPLVKKFGEVQYALTPATRHHDDDAGWQAALERVDALVAQRGWQVSRSNPARDALAEVLVTLRKLNHQNLTSTLDAYASAAEGVARLDLALVADRSDAEDALEAMAIWSVLGDTLLSSLRRLAQESVSRTANDQTAR